ncbi:Mu transposase C-terminal domain-containing protein [Pseudomonas corrugata]|uniref:Mu transposase C-terminal domain-containing protein n=1 Tax=Pseudomonas corrugata TaxID=47879 RepID=A0A8B6UUQ9_9PSED|nr:DNA-binding protein [Pseudomonas corrugata]MDU9022137.1 DNA-binding protein [Pseudomonas corrugata]QTH15636.1 Mu transposase C-terminal domain-containing protein [Pseudomonas corrugata]UZD96794.1 Mu transposase C-terminal domain-containing protein [Pseudomonas corrugata]
MRSFYTLQELAGLPGLPGTVPGIRKFAERMGWEGQRRLGSKAVEYSFSQLPVETQTALLAISVSGDAAAPKETVPVVNTSQAVKVNERLNDTQKAVMVARLCFVREIERMSVAVSQSRAIDILVKQARDCALSPYLMERVDLANDRKTGDRGLSERTLKRWIAAYKSHGESGLAPLRQRPNLTIPEWAKEFLRCYQRPTKPSVVASYMEFASGYSGTVPSIHAVKRFLKKLSPDALNAGRMSPQELKSLQSFRRRSTKSMFPGDVYTADGHKFDAEVINPLTGKPYRPEITTVLDVATRKVVGVSVGESESAIGVLDALRDAVRECMFAIFYVDNGSGFANDTVREVVDRLGGTMTHSLPYNSQARGLSERGHQTIWVRAAKKLTSYIGADMDKHAGTRVHRIGRKELRETGKSRVLPTFAEFMSGMEHEIAAYNNTPHRGLSKLRDPETGALRHMTPNEAWQAAISEGWEPIVAPSLLVDSLMRPQVIRKSRRGEIAWAGNTYFAADLTAFHDQEIRVAYDVRDASQVWAYTLDGELIGAARLDGNSTDYMPQTMLEMAREKRQQGQFKRAVDKLETLTGSRVKMIAPTSAPSAHLPSNELAVALEYATEMESRQETFVIPGNDVERYRLWNKLELRQASGEPLSTDEARWWKAYASHPDLLFQRHLMEEFEKNAG